MPTDPLERIREIRREIRRLELRELFTWMERRRVPEIITDSELEEIRTAREELLEQLEKYETRHLIRKAESWGIEVPYKLDELGTIIQSELERVAADSGYLVKLAHHPRGRQVKVDDDRQRFAI